MCIDKHIFVLLCLDSNPPQIDSKPGQQRTDSSFNEYEAIYATRSDFNFQYSFCIYRVISNLSGLRKKFFLSGEVKVNMIK